MAGVEPPIVTDKKRFRQDLLRKLLSSAAALGPKSAGRVCPIFVGCFFVRKDGHQCGRQPYSLGDSVSNIYINFIYRKRLRF